MADRSGYIGRAPGDSSVTVARQTFSPTGITTDFTFASGYTPGYFDIFINGAKMIEGSDYTSTDGSTFVILNGGAISGDVIEGVAYKAFNAATATIGISSAGTPISTQANTLNFVGTGNTFALRGTTIDVSISGGGAGAGGTWSNYDSNAGVTTTKKVKIQNNLEVTGVTTSTGGFVGNVTGNASGSSGSCSGNSATATVLAASRNIGGVAFNGSGDINLPGVNQSGTQNTSGTAAIATNVTVTDESTDTICFPLFTTAATGNLPPKSGTNLTFNSSTGTLSTNNFDGNATGLTGTPNLVVGIITATSLEGNASDMTAGQWVLGANGTSDYTFTGPGLSGAQNDPSLYLQRGKTYKFVNGMGAHPFQIQLTSGQGGTAYNNGVTNNGTSSGTVTIEVRQDAPDILYYQCTSHANMGGILNIVGSGVPTGGIIMWSGASVPGGWSLCDGTNSTPDLRDRFIVSSGSAYSIGNTGGANSVTLTVDQIPAHTHAITAKNDGSPSGTYSSPRSAYAAEIDSGSTGGGQSHENRPPYYALAFIMKT